MQPSSGTSEPTQETLSRSRRARFALLLGGLTAFGPLSIDMYLPAFPAMAQELGAGESQVQLTLTTCVLGLAFGQILAGPLSDRLGRRLPLLIGLTVYAIASVLCAVVPSAFALAGLRLVQGLGAAAGIVIARAAVRDLFSGIAMARFFSLLMLVTGLAPILAPVAGGQLLEWTSWRGVFVVLSVFGAALLIAVLFFLPETLPAGRRATGDLSSTVRTFGRLLGDRVFLGYALTSGFVFAAMFAYISGSSFVLQDLFGLSPLQYSLVFGANSLGLVIVGQVNGRLVGRFQPRRLLAVGISVGTSAGITLFLMALSGLGLVALLVPLFVFIASVGMVLPNATALALTGHANEAGSASALLGVLQFAIGGLAAPLVGLGGTASAVPMATVMGAVGIAAITVFLMLTRTRPSPHATTPADQSREHPTAVAQPV